ncbi:AMP-binding protein [Bacillus carboniphilus]|uniref:AMP-binding protein n=1 Tax=Bacillus carboniphilus TaxID=86663 RepID=A0ABY9JY13_9BACI|nr:AMP-binding protein [Bacillus carboniphilus]WLR44276.1 AMP-binding protein [Bacillus carboniphilus]
MTLGSLFNQTVERFSKKEAIVDLTQNIRWTYQEWDHEVNKVAQALINEGVRKGDRVSTFSFNTIEFATLFFACSKIGAVINPINFRLKERELSLILT